MSEFVDLGLLLIFVAMCLFLPSVAAWLGVRAVLAHEQRKES